MMDENGNINQGLTNDKYINNDNNGGVNGVLYVKVMTDEQFETLRTQIVVYGIICEQLVDMHKSITANGARLVNLLSDPFAMPAAGADKITAKQRWIPTSTQRNILEKVFNEGKGIPTKAKIKEMIPELSQHGKISDTNVYNWFQNRRAKWKKNAAKQVK